MFLWPFWQTFLYFRGLVYLKAFWIKKKSKNLFGSLDEFFKNTSPFVEESSIVMSYIFSLCKYNRKLKLLLYTYFVLQFWLLIVGQNWINLNLIFFYIKRKITCHANIFKKEFLYSCHNSCCILFQKTDTPSWGSIPQTLYYKIYLKILLGSFSPKSERI